MLVLEYFNHRKKTFLTHLEKSQIEAIPIIQQFVKKYRDEGLFVENSGIEVFNYRYQNVSVGFYRDGGGDCALILKEEFPIGSNKVSISATVSKYDLKDFTAKKYGFFAVEFEQWQRLRIRFWILETWQRANVNAFAPFAFMREYAYLEKFDLKKMEWEKGENLSTTTEASNLSTEELLLRVVDASFHHLFLRKNEQYVEIGYLKQKNFFKVFKRKLINGTWDFEKVENYKNELMSLNQGTFINEVGRWVTTQLEMGFEIISLTEDLPYQPPFDFILPDFLSNAKPLCNSTNIEVVKAFEAQFSIQLPADYQSFLCRYNGFLTHVYDGFGYDKYDSVRPILLYGLSENTLYDIVQQMDAMEYQCLPNYIPIGEDLEKNQIWLAVSEENKGQIIYRRHEMRQKKIVVYPIADSFQTFVNEFFFDVHQGIEHVIKANNLEDFKKYMSEKWDWDYAMKNNRTVIDKIIQEERVEFLDYALSQKKQPFKLSSYGGSLSPQMIAVFEKYNYLL